MFRIAHLSDVHILDPHVHRSTTRYRVATRAVSLGRAIDPRSRATKLLRGLRSAKRSGASHVVISGDLTELGDRAEFEHFATLLDEAGLPDGALTLVPGNHDAYTEAAAWKRAIEGPLKRWSGASAGEAGKVVERGDVVFLPIDTSCFQSIARSGGMFTREAARAIERRLRDPAFANRAVVLVLHHPPLSHDKSFVWRWIDGLRGVSHVLDLLTRHPRVQLLHGHLHEVVDRALPTLVPSIVPTLVKEGLAPFVGARSNDARSTRIFGAPAVVEDEAAPRVRLYELREGMLESVGFAA